MKDERRKLWDLSEQWGVLSGELWQTSGKNIFIVKLWMQMYLCARDKKEFQEEAATQKEATILLQMAKLSQ